MRSGRLRSEVREVAGLSNAERAAMWALFDAHYAEVDRASFERDLDAKREVILLRDAGDRSLQGFSTLAVDTLELDGRRVVSLFSGDTIVRPDYWGQKALDRAFLRYTFRLWARHPRAEVHWFLISKGYKTYLLLARNWPEYYPRHDRPTPPFAQRLLDTLARARFGDAYDPDHGVVRFPEPKGRLEDGVAPIEPHFDRVPDIRFFLEKNPGHALGDELCCVGRVDLRFFLHVSLRLGLRPLRRGLRAVRALAPASTT